MDLLKNQLARLQQQLSSLNASQKMLAATLVAIMVMTLVWWGHYAGTSEMEALLDQDFAADEISRVTTNMASHGIKYSVVGNRVMVPADRKYEVLASLSFEGLLPHDTQLGIEKMIADMDSPFNSPAKQEDLRTKGKAMTLGAVLRNFPGVMNAVVVIDPTSQRGIGEDSVLPSASVNLEMRQGHVATRKLAEAAADLVSGAVANLPRSRVKIIAGGASWPIHDAEDGADGGDNSWLARRQEGERYFNQLIMGHLSYIEGLAVSVAVLPNDKTTHGDEIAYKNETTVRAEKSNENETDDTVNPSSGAHSQEPGAMSNTSMGISSGGAGAGGESGGSTKHTMDKSDTQIFPGEMRTSFVEHDNLRPISASILVPRSYFVRVLKQAKPDKEPDDASIEQLATKQMPQIRHTVMACLGMESDEKIVADTYVDVMPVAAAPTAATSMVSSVGSHGREIGLGALAVFSLFMVSMMVKKGSLPSSGSQPVESPVAVASPGRAKTGAKKLTEEPEEVGEASGQALDGIELDDQTVHAKQVLDQVSDMVKENPDAAANLVKRWLNRT